MEAMKRVIQRRNNTYTTHKFLYKRFAFFRGTKFEVYFIFAKTGANVGNRVAKEELRAFEEI